MCFKGLGVCQYYVLYGSTLADFKAWTCLTPVKYSQSVEVMRVEIQLGADVMLQAFCLQVS